MKKETIRKASWILYDFANSAYVLIIAAVAFPLYYRQVALGGGPNADRTWGMIVALALLIAGLISPFIGAVVDASGRRRQVMALATLTCVGSTIALFFAAPGTGHLGAMLFIIGQVAWVIATMLYDSYLKTLTKGRTSNFLSGLGWGIGYAGGILCFALTYSFLKGGLAPENLVNYRTAFLITGLFYLVFAAPALLVLPSKDMVKANNDTSPWLAYHNVFSTIKNWKAHRDVFIFLLGFYLLSDGITTVIYFTSIFLSKTFAMPVSKILLMTVIIQAVGMVTTPSFGWLADKFSEKRILLTTVIIWCGAVSVMAFATSSSAPILMSVLIGMVIGSSQAICRSIYARIVPVEKVAEFFGFNALAGRVATLFGPLIFGIVSSHTGNQRIGLISLLAFFVLGGSIIMVSKFRENSSIPDENFID